MDRKIIFRAKRIDNGEWIYGIPLFDWAPCSHGCRNLHKGKLITFIGWEDYCHEYDEIEIDPATVGQYTGLDDKNGTKIFEGDIVRNGMLGVPGEIIYDMCSFKEYYHECDQKESLTDGCILEVIGNVHDNPEFLEVQHEID